MKQPVTHDNQETLTFSKFSMPDDGWRSKMQSIFVVLRDFTSVILSSRLLQLALLCLFLGLSSSAYGVHTLLSDRHLICQDGDILAQASQTQGENIDFFEVTEAAEAAELKNRPVLSSSQGESVASEQDTITVDVSGAVKQPGVYSVKRSYRLGDVIAVAGGLTTQANAQEIAQVLNLASRLEDGQKVYIPFTGEELQSVLQRQLQHVSPATAPTTTSNSTGPITQPKNTDAAESDASKFPETNSKVSINTATAKQLMDLKGIGEKRAADIIAGRPYDAVSDLLERGVLSKALFESLEESLRL
jgi:competence protein ComEA